MRKQNGMILLAVMVFTSIITMIALVILELVHVEYKLNADFVRYEKSLNRAEFAYHLAEKKLISVQTFPFYFTNDFYHYSLDVKARAKTKIVYKVTSSGDCQGVKTSFLGVFSCYVNHNVSACNSPRLIHLDYFRLLTERKH